jgi:predicted esterase
MEMLMVIQYPASLACNSESLGVTDTVNHVVNQASLCPKQVFALVGYSQGADLMHNATIKLNTYPSIAPKGQLNSIEDFQIHE